MQGDVKTQGANNVAKGGPFLASLPEWTRQDKKSDSLVSSGSAMVDQLSYFQLAP